MVIGFIGAPYLAHENIGSMIFTVGVIGETTLDKNVVVSFSTSDGSTPGLHFYPEQFYLANLVISSVCSSDFNELSSAY